ncbi:unnamed protein product [Rotaria sp. Silwood2]|nr:unnamed protein product [Rotaria sp. Silwood2]
MNGDVQFDNISFAYPARPDVLVLRNISLIARAGEITALVGSSGSGKSTCISLLLRFYEPLSGHIAINNRSITYCDLKQFRKKIGVVSQEPYVAFAVSGSKLTQRICAKAFAHYLRQEIAFFDLLENSPGAILNRLSSDGLAVQQMVGTRLGIVWESVATFGISIAIGFLFSWQLTLTLFFIIGFFFIFAFMQIRWQARLNKLSDCIVGSASSVRRTF